MLAEDEFLQDALRKVLERQNAPSATAGMRTWGGALTGGIADIIRAGKASAEQSSLGERLKALRAERQQARGDMLGRAGGLRAPTDPLDPSAWAQGADAREALARDFSATGDPVVMQQGQRLDTDANAYRQNSLQAAIARERANKEKSESWSSAVDPVTGKVYLFDKSRGPMSATTIGGAPKPPAPGMPLDGKPTEKQRNAVLEANASIAGIDKALATLKANPGAYGGAANVAAGVTEKVTGELGQSMLERRFTPGQLSARNLVTNIVSAVINKRAGANVSLQEALRQRFLPRDTDSLDAVIQKLADLRTAEETEHQAMSGAPPAQHPAAPTDKAAALRAKYGVGK